MTPIIIGIAFFGVVWLAVGLRYLGLMGGCLGVLLASICFGHPFFHQLVGPVPVTIDRVLFVVLLVFYFLALQTDFVDRKRITRADAVLLAYLGYISINTLTTDWKLDNCQPLATLLFFYWLPAGIYWLTREAKVELKDHRACFYFWIILGVYLSATAVAEVTRAYGVVFPRYIGSDSYEEFLGRARGPLLNPIGNGMLITCGLAAVMSLIPGATRPRQLVFALLAVLFFAGVYLTLTRSVWLGTAIGSLAVAAYLTPRRLRPQLISGALLIASVGAIAKWDSLNAFKRDEHVTVSEMADLSPLRPILAAVAWKMFLDHPLQGVGFGQYKRHDEQYFAQREIDLPLQKARPYVQHNVFLSVLTQTGLIGLGLFVAVLVVILQDAWLLSQGGSGAAARTQGLVTLMFLAAYVVNGMFHEVAIIPAVNMVLFALAGTNRGLVARYATSTETARPLRRFPAYSAT